MFVSNLPAFKKNIYTAYNRFHGNGPDNEVPTKRERIRTLGFPSTTSCTLPYNKYTLNSDKWRSKRCFLYCYTYMYTVSCLSDIQPRSKSSHRKHICCVPSRLATSTLSRQLRTVALEFRPFVLVKKTSFAWMVAVTYLPNGNQSAGLSYVEQSVPGNRFIGAV